MEKLPFEVTPQIDRYIDNILFFDEEHFIQNTGEIIQLESYIENEPVTDRSELNNEAFWQYLTDIGAIAHILDPSIPIGISGTENLPDRNPLMYQIFQKFALLNTSKVKEVKKLIEEKTEAPLEKIKFIDTEAAIVAGTHRCNLPPNKNEHYLCRAMFARKINEPVDWSIIFEEITGSEMGAEGLSEPEKKSIRDTMFLLNERIKSCFNTKRRFLKRRSGTIIRNF